MTKSFTDLEQSKRLAEILPIESADMCYPLPCEDGDKPLLEQGGFGSTPCWSLASLLDVYPMIVGRDMNMYCCWQNGKNLHSRHYNNPVDACYEMILKLHESNLL